MAWEKLSELDDGSHLAWAYCRREQACGHNARLNLSVLILAYGDIGIDQLRDRLRCPKCGGRARVVVSHR